MDIFLIFLWHLISHGILWYITCRFGVNDPNGFSKEDLKFSFLIFIPFLGIILSVTYIFSRISVSDRLFNHFKKYRKQK